VYSPTAAGEAALAAWVRQRVTREEMVRDAGASILRFGLAGGRLSPAEVMAYLAGWRDETNAYLEELRLHRAAMGQNAALHPRLSLERGISGYEGEVQWIEHAMAEIRRAAKREASGSRRRRKNASVLSLKWLYNERP
jgi:hypothetical protein